MGDSVIINAVAIFNNMPISILACRMCPKNIEGTMYAMVMATWNLGSSISNILGGLVMWAFSVTDTNFDNLSYIVFLTNTL